MSGPMSAENLNREPGETYGYYFLRVFRHSFAESLGAVVGSAIIFGPIIFLVWLLIPHDVWTELSKPLSEVPVWVGIVVVWLMVRL